MRRSSRRRRAPSALDRYLALLASPSPAVVKQGLAGTARRRGRRAGGWARARRGVAVHADSRRTRCGHARAGRARASQACPRRGAELLDRRRAGARARAAGRAGAGSDAPRARTARPIRAFAPRRSATPRSSRRCSARESTSLTRASRRLHRGRQPQAPPAETWPEPVQPQMTPEPAARGRRPARARRVARRADRARRRAHRGRGSGDDGERFLDGVSRLCGRAAAGARASRSRPVEARGGATGRDWALPAPRLIALARRSVDRRQAPPLGSGGRTMLGFVERARA